MVGFALMASCTLNDGLRNTLPCRTDWQSALDESVRDTAELCRLLDLDPALGAEAATATGQWPLLVPRPYLSRIRRGDPADPLLLQVLPRAAELATTPGYSADPLGEAHARCGPSLLRKYQGRILMVTTGAWPSIAGSASGDIFRSTQGRSAGRIVCCRFPPPPIAMGGRFETPDISQKMHKQTMSIPSCELLPPIARYMKLSSAAETR